MKPQYSKSVYGTNKKSQVFTLDVFIGLMIALIILTFSLFYLIKASEERLSQMQLIKTGYDILAILDYQGILTQNSTVIENNTAILLPENMNMQIIVQTQTTSTITSTIPPEKGTIVSGSRAVYINGIYGKAKFLAWYIQ
jgi:hypothetical protein